MKLTNNFTAALCAAVCMLGCTAFSACGEDDWVSATLLESDTTHVVIQAAQTKGSLYDAMQDIKSRPGPGNFSFDGTGGKDDFFITVLNGRALQGREYWAIYTSLGEYGGVSYSSAEYGTFDYKGTVCAMASYGCSGLPLVEGCYYVIALSEY